MEYTISITALNHLLDFATYAKLCGIDSRAVQKQVREKRVAFIIIDGLTLIDTITSPPVKRLPYRFKPENLVVNNEGINLSDLIRVSKLAKTRKMTADRFHRNILLGRMKAIMIMGEAFVFKSDPLINELLSSYSKDLNYTPVS